ncbi:hypothetical protein DXX93_01905 [Thalassotalea euphylliae]|uniref:Uncharacterized protein n=2 Tax=Thalassotalea euphylliae TaxID=1655234 RepID=A0A3E0TN27_9GAMM|nr:hypothetical protein DXX93_01905 [Thalassotalea euphylliae]
MVYADNSWPKYSCKKDSTNIALVDLNLCVNEKIAYINILGGSHPGLVFKVNGMPELSISYVSSDFALLGADHKNNLSTQEFFLELMSKAPAIDKAVAIKNALGIDSENTLTKFEYSELIAFSITGKNQIDTIYLTKKDSSQLYQVTGEINESQVVKLLSKIKPSI